MTEDVTPAGAAPPGERQALTEEIERTREQLGDTVEALIAKTDVKARARDKATELTGRLTESATEAGTTAWAATPEPVRQAARRIADSAWKRRGYLAGAAGILLAGWLIARRRRP